MFRNFLMLFSKIFLNIGRVPTNPCSLGLKGDSFLNQWLVQFVWIYDALPIFEASFTSTNFPVLTS